MTEPARSRNSRVGLAAVFFVARFAFLAWRATLLAEWEAIDARSTFGPGLTRGAPVGEPCQLTLGSDLDPGSASSARAASAAVDGGWAVAGECSVSVVGLEVGSHGLSGGVVERLQVCVVEVFRGRPGVDPPPPERLAAVDGDGAAGEALDQVRPGGGDALALQRMSQRLRRAPDRVALGHRSADREGDLVFHQIGDGRACDLGERFAAVALEDFHAFVELGARVVDVGRHALAEWTVLVVVVLPERAHDGERGTEELVHALVH